MSIALALLPDFLLIVCGFVLCRYTALNRPIWEAAEQLVYYVLFPALLFYAIVTSPFQPQNTLRLSLCGWLVLGTGIVLAYALRHVPGVSPHRHASSAQVAFRFNSVIGLALADRLVGGAGVASMALLIAVCVPLANAAAVWPLARHGGHSSWAEMARNPLIVSTVAGLLAHAMGLTLPAPVATTLQRMASAALPLGLLAVGAGLRLGGLKAAPGLAAGVLAIRHVVLPLVGLALAWGWGLPAEQRIIVVIFASLPTAASCYVLATRMGGDGPFVAGLVTLSTVLAMVCVPVWLALWQAWGG